MLPLLLMLALLVVACAVRFHRLGEQSLWYDEGVAYNHALRTLPELIPLLQRNVHVPAYFTLLGLWEDIAGASEFALRSLSVFFSILSVALTYALGARLFHPVAGLAASAFVALNSFSIYYAAEARMYAMLTAIAAGSMLLFVVFLGDLCRPAPSRSRGRYILALGLINALGLYTHVVYGLILLTQSV
ncbi:MAG: glycosyltransferase family 39 protein, partial [Chloroflexi bacterium]|nr:glycosyltransferase family 39 protein [Chloroflexota bacterium]